MRQFVLLILLCLTFTTSLFSQENSNFQNLNESISSAQKILDTEKNTNSEKSETYIKATVNLSVLLTQRIKKTQQLLNNRDSLSKKDNETLNKQIASDSEKAVKFFAKALDFYEKADKTKTAEYATVKSSLAWILTNNLQYNLSRLDRVDVKTEADNSFAEALKLRTTLLGEDSELTLETLYDYANFSLRWANFEKAETLYASYLSVAEKKFGRDNKLLITPLIEYAGLLKSTEREAEANEILKRVSKFDGQSENLSTDLQDITIRSTKYVPEKFADSDKDYYQRRNLLMNLYYQSTISRYKNEISRPVLTSRKIEEIGLMKLIKVNLLIDENGKVIEAKADTEFKEWKEYVEQKVSLWKFYPFESNSVKRKMRGYVVVLV